MAAPSQTLGRRAGGGEVNTRSDALPAAPEIWAPRDSHIQFLPRPPSGTPPVDPEARARPPERAPGCGAPRNKELQAGRTCGGGGCQVPELPIDPRPGRGRAAPGSARPRAARATASGRAGRGGCRRRAWCGAGGRRARGEGGSGRRGGARARVRARRRRWRWRCPCPLPPARAAPASVSGIV